MYQKFKQMRAQVNTGSRLIVFSYAAARGSFPPMRLILLSLTMLFAASSVGLAAPSLAAQEGTWICLPDDQTAPQVLVDFEGNVYRRCDQNTCSSYDILAVRRHADVTEVSFAPGAVLRADDGGSRYTEIRSTGGATITSSGGCTFRGQELEPDAFEQEEMRRRS